MIGRPTLIKNLTPGMTCRIRGYLGPSQDGWTLSDDSGFCWLRGRTSRLKDVWHSDVHSLNGFALSIIGHRTKNSNEPKTFIVEEIEEWDVNE